MASNNRQTFYDDVEQEYDLDILRSNIREKMNEKNLKQEDLVEGTNIPQPIMSRLIGSNAKGNFGIQYLVKIAQFLETSVDDLLGLKPKEKPNNDITLANIFENLFEIDDMIKDFMKIKRTYTYPDLESEGVNSIYFDNEVISDKLDEWAQLRQSNFSDTQRDKFIQIWKKDLLEQGAYQKWKWDFRDKDSQQAFLASILIDFANMYVKCNYDYGVSIKNIPAELYSKGNLNLLEEYNPKEDLFLTSENETSFYIGMEWIHEHGKEHGLPIG